MSLGELHLSSIAHGYRTYTHGLHIFAITFGIMIFDGNDPPAALFGVVDDEFGVDGFDGEGIQDADLDAVSLQLIGGLEAFVQRDSGSDDQSLVRSGLANDFAAADAELLLVAVDHLRVRTRRADEADAWRKSYRSVLAVPLFSFVFYLISCYFLFD